MCLRTAQNLLKGPIAELGIINEYLGKKLHVQYFIFLPRTLKSLLEKCLKIKNPKYNSCQRLYQYNYDDFLFLISS